MNRYIIVAAAAVIIYLFLLFLHLFPNFRRTMTCISTHWLSYGENCFTSAPKKCVDLDISKGWGWCYDKTPGSSLPGNSDGPYGNTTCKHWISKKSECPPQQCSGQYPLGV